MWRAWKGCYRNDTARRLLRRAVPVNKMNRVQLRLLLDLQDSGNDSRGALVVVFVCEKGKLRAGKINHEIEGLGFAARKFERHRVSSRARVIACTVTVDSDGAGSHDVR